MLKITQKQLLHSPLKLSFQKTCGAVKQLQTKQGQNLSILTTSERTHQTRFQQTSNVINVIPFSDDLFARTPIFQQWLRQKPSKAWLCRASALSVLFYEKTYLLSSWDRAGHQNAGSAPAHFMSRTLRLISDRKKQAKRTSSRRSTAFSLDAGRGTDKEGPGNETLDNRRFLTPEQLFGILKAQRLW